MSKHTPGPRVARIVFLREATCHSLTPSEYEYRGHWISLVGIYWLVFDHRDGEGGELFASESIDDCIAAIDDVLDNA
jgi:hypothetical protein